MKWLGFSLLCLLGTLQTSIYGFEDSSMENFTEDDEFLSLDSEIEALLEEDVFDDDMIEGEIAIEEYNELSHPSKEVKAPATPLKTPVRQIDVNKDQSSPSLAIQLDQIAANEEPLAAAEPITLEGIKEETKKTIQTIEINLRQVFAGSPIIYSILFLLSTLAVCVWLYSMLTIRSIEFLPPALIKELRAKLISNQFDEALDLCVKQKHFFCKMLASGILARRHGLNVMIDTMKSEGKRSTVPFWQRISILNEIAIIAPMLGLLGTVMGMFYAFYDLNRSVESVSLLFDGLGISVGTTVAGLIVAILAMILYSMAKYRLVRILANVENETQTFAALIDTRTP